MISPITPSGNRVAASRLGCDKQDDRRLRFTGWLCGFYWKWIMQGNQVGIDEIEGKTISRVFFDYTDEVLVVFTDGKFALFYGYTCDDETTVENGDFRLGNWSKHAEELLSLSIATQAQYDKLKADVEHYSRQAIAARRAEYERLKAEFE